MTRPSNFCVQATAGGGPVLKLRSGSPAAPDAGRYAHLMKEDHVSRL